jgi:hypothetical protein
MAAARGDRRFQLQHRFLAIVAAGLSFACAIAHAAIPDSERQALLDLYASTDGDHWLAHDNWNGPPGTECSWWGIICDATESHVVQLAFGQADSWVPSHLVGTLPASIGQLTALQYLFIAKNAISGPLPPLNGLSALIGIDMYGDSITGPFPSLAGLSNLQYVIAGGNRFDATPDFAGLDSLTEFSARGGFFGGSFPDLSGAPNLTWVDLSSNYLVGPVPSLEALTQLTHLDVSQNYLGGTLPRLGVDPTNPDVSIDFSYNLFLGAIPPEYMALPNFNGADNQLTGTIPPLQATTLGIGLNDNLLEGPLPSFAAAPNLRGFAASNNALSGQVPTLGPLIQSLWVDNNMLDGSLPPVPNEDMQQEAFSHMCPNNFDRMPAAAWDAATGTTPWYADCTGPTHQNLNQFGLSGTWYNPSTPGQGIVLSAMFWPDQSHTTLFGGWFTYATSAMQQPDGQSWYSIQGDVDATTELATLDLYESVAGRFGGPPAVGATRIGSVTLAFESCTRATLSYHFDEARSRDGTFPLVRLTGSTACRRNGQRTNLLSNAVNSGAYYDPSAPGQGMVVDVSASANTLFVGWYTYSPAIASDNRRWYTLQANVEPGASTMSGVPIYSTTGGAFAGATPVTTVQVGTADLSFGWCGQTVTLTYRFTSGDNANYTGTRRLSRLGPECSF